MNTDPDDFGPEELKKYNNMIDRILAHIANLPTEELPDLKSYQYHNAMIVALLVATIRYMSMTMTPNEDIEQLMIDAVHKIFDQNPYIVDSGRKWALEELRKGNIKDPRK